MAPTSEKFRLEPIRLLMTVKRLQARISASFQGRGLADIAGELVSLAEKAVGRVEKLKRPNWWLKLLPFALTGLVILVAAAVVTGITFTMFEGVVGKTMQRHLQNLVAELRQMFAEAAIPATVLLPGPLLLSSFLFVWSLEKRWNQSRTLRYLHELRSIIHVIDMHQLTKDPHRAADTAGSDVLNGPDLVRYLDYCSELHALSAKVAALYAESSRDPIVIATVSDLGQITANLSNKIWQKINIVERNMAADATRGAELAGPAV